MNHPSVAARELVAEVLRIEAAALQDHDRIHSIPEWDSLAQLEIVEFLERSCSTPITDEKTFEELTDLTGISRFIEENMRGEERH